MGKVIDYVDLSLDAFNMVTTLYGDYLDRKATKHQRKMALSMVGCAIVVSLLSSAYIVIKIEKNGANNNGKL